MGLQDGQWMKYGNEMPNRIQDAEMNRMNKAVLTEIAIAAQNKN